ncbi:MAG: ferrochelatase [Magnetospiraceae bacterium]
MARTAIVLFNLGGPDRPDAVRPFLFNLFNDPAIIGLPGPLRWLVAQLISRRRAPVAQEIYHHLGGGSPLVPLTEEQATALESALTTSEEEIKTFICMRYWHPMSDAVAKAVAAYNPDQIVLLPLYPQFSTTTVASSLKDWHRAAKKAHVTAPTRALCCYPTEPGWIAAVADLVSQTLSSVSGDRPRVLFSAHGLPKKVVDAGDPYQWQVEQTAAAVVEKLAIEDLDWVVCYQSRVGPLEWIGPSTDQELARAGKDGVSVAVVPIAFVSEHSETLVELDIEYRKLAESLSIPGYHRVPTVSTHPLFISGLAGLVREVSARNAPVSCQGGKRICPKNWNGCSLNALSS